jgi:hypothetical protein
MVLASILPEHPSIGLNASLVIEHALQRSAKQLLFLQAMCIHLQNQEKIYTILYKRLHIYSLSITISSITLNLIHANNILKKTYYY